MWGTTAPSFCDGRIPGRSACALIRKERAMPRSSSIPIRARSRDDAMPTSVDPMLATLACLPGNEGDYAFEFKWDGVRALCFWDGKSLHLHSRNQLDITS